MIQAWLAKWLLPVLAVSLCVASMSAFFFGLHLGSARCLAATAVVTGKAQAQANTATVAAIKRSATTGAAREADRAAIDRFFTTLAQADAHEAPAPVDADDTCTLPAERLRRWAAANAGAADHGAAATQPDSTAATLAGPSVGPPARPGSQPPPSGAGLPPAGQPALPPSGVSSGGSAGTP